MSPIIHGILFTNICSARSCSYIVVIFISHSNRAEVGSGVFTFEGIETMQTGVALSGPEILGQGIVACGVVYSMNL